MRLHERIFDFYMALFGLGLIILVGIPLTVLVRICGVPLVMDVLFRGIPLAILALVMDPMLAVSAVFVFVFLWAAALTYSGKEPGAKNHLRGRTVRSRADGELGDALRKRRRARLREENGGDEIQIGVRRPRRFGSFQRGMDDED